ncbi:MAG TPA: ABC transporter ATP-binding protein [Spirochaetia bacterium]|jgi:ABC-type cobalamin/Fe3+-siderophores transport system ATPase subunit|nr:ABC transporter ATP-binding protein [Spirochaetia bacterium]
MESTIIAFDSVQYGYPESPRPVFDNLSITLPDGVTSLIGQNGTGKSTFLLLAAGRILPTQGTVYLCGEDTKAIPDEDSRNRLASFVYQNMEFETEEPLGDLLRFVYENGFHANRDEGLIRELIEVFELSTVLTKKTQGMSKGELQRAIMAFSILYGSKTIMMDEPIFALEPRQKEKSLDFLKSYAQSTHTPVFYSIHEFELSRKYSDNVLFFYKNVTLKFGKTEDIFTRENLEEVYEVPYGLLHSNESQEREKLMMFSKFIQERNNEEEKKEP